MDKQLEQLDIRFRFRPLHSTPDGVLLNYLKRKTLPSVSQEMVLKALRAFWLAEAYQHCGGKRSQDLKKLAQNMILSLEEQANYLRTIFGIERLAVQEQVSTVSEPLPQQQQEQVSEAWNSAYEVDMDGL
jgi:hypothetical protein